MCMVFCCIPYTSIIRIYKKQKCNSILILGVLEHMAFADLMYALDSSPSGKIRLRRDVPALTVTQDEHTVAAIITNWSAEHRINHMPNLRFHFNTWGRCSGSIRKCQTWLHMSNSWKIFGWYPKCFLTSTKGYNRQTPTHLEVESRALTTNRLLPKYHVDYFGSCQTSYGAHIRCQWPLLFGTPGRLVGKRPLHQHRTPCSSVGIPGMGQGHMSCMNHARISYGTK